MPIIDKFVIQNLLFEFYQKRDEEEFILQYKKIKSTNVSTYYKIKKSIQTKYQFYFYSSGHQMRYTFDKFQIQLVTKQNPTFGRNVKIPPGLNPKVQQKNRYIKTASYSSKKNMLQHNQLPKKSIEAEAKFIHESNNNMARSQSLKPDMKDRYKNWLNQSNVSLSLKQKQYKLFEQKCMDLLSRKKEHSQSQTEKHSDLPSARKPKNSIGIGQLNQPQFNESKPNSVEQMMNNIINKFKSDSRHRNYTKKQMNSSVTANYKATKDNPEKEPFFTIRHELIEQTTDPSIRDSNKEDRRGLFYEIKSSQFRKSYETERTGRRIDQIGKEESKMIERSWKDVPDVTGIRVNKKLNRQQMPTFNPLTCTSLSLNSPTREIKKKLVAFEHINLSPYRKLTDSKIACSQARRKKIQLSKPCTIKKFMKFTKNSSDQQYNKKIKCYLDFLFKINFSNNIYISLQLTPLDDTASTIQHQKYKVYVGPGNNSLLVKSLLRRRPWLEVVESADEQGVQFYWTQNKVNQIHEKQENSVNCVRKQMGGDGNINNKDSNKQQERKKPSPKISAQTRQLNSKLLSKTKSDQVQNYIYTDGYEMPYQKQYEPSIVTNHIPNNYVIGSKKNLFKSLFSYYTNIVKKDPFTVIPKTYHIKSQDDPEFKKFVRDNSKQPNRLWIVKPGQNTNRGNGIKLGQFSKIQSLMKQKTKHPNGQLMTYIIQSYINRPFLYNGRKFDIRHYMLVTSINGTLKVYWYRDGYIRTSSEPYDLQDYENEFIHLTNDAIQQKSQSYGKYEDANKLSYSEFQRYLDYSFTGKGYSVDTIVKEMKAIMLDVVKASYLNLDKQRKRDNFQLFGFDFMIDSLFKPYLIQINFNPCLVVNCNVLNRVIPPLIQNTLRIGLDPLLTPKSHLPVNKRHNLSENYLRNLRYELIFDQASIQNDIYNRLQLVDSEDEQEEYVDNGKQLPENVTF